MVFLQVFDPPMCCPTGICGGAFNPVLPGFADALAWVESRGVTVKRVNLAQNPEAFQANATVQALLDKEGQACLPVILINGVVVFKGSYPSRQALAELLQIETESASESIFTPAVAELVAIGAAIASNCEPCFKHHFNEARRLGVSPEDMARAVDLAQMVKDSPAKAVLALANKHLRRTAPSSPMIQDSPCCGGGSGSCC